MSDILNYNPGMQYRRFGKTNVDVSCITLGGMRYVHGWEDPREDIPNDMVDHAAKCITRAMDCGINLIETAYGYKKSEKCHGMVLNDVLKLPRESYCLMTKGRGELKNEELPMRQMVEKQLKDLQTDYFDFYAFHGINTPELCQKACAPGGPVEELLKMKEEGIIGHVGFSTHASPETIVQAIDTDMFDFVNLHNYYFYQQTQIAVDRAAEKDMGVFIISPNDKGGQLFNPSDTVREAALPRTAIQWNSRFCLKSPAVHTLTFGMTEMEHFDEMAGIFTGSIDWNSEDQKSLDILDQCVTRDTLSQIDGYDIGWLDSDINIPEVLRFWKMWKCYDMHSFVSYRYNMLEGKGDWSPGHFATEDAIETINENLIPKGLPLKKMLREIHHEFFIDKSIKK